ncbi:hypothetical protein E2C01_068550 [Portunus trituberculatus]|uniref:Uncharacterized protein n=1 Tax=Portunus trituberculatus TaxID=210409 RepID=A0A5B7HZR7_PORTR|nr:hypothetical protein [Portunus trituberculatus]
MDNAGQWSKEVLQLTMVNAMDLWVEESTRYKGEEEPSPEHPPSIQYHSPMGRSWKYRRRIG